MKLEIFTARSAFTVTMRLSRIFLTSSLPIWAALDTVDFADHTDEVVAEVLRRDEVAH